MNSEKRQTAIRFVAELLRTEANRLFNIVAKVEDQQGGTLNFNSLIGDGQAATLSGFFTRIEAAALLMLAIADTKQVPVTPNVWWTNLTEAASQAANNLSQVSSWAEQWSPSEGFSIDARSLVLKSPSGHTSDLGSTIRSVDQQIDTVLDHGFRLRWALEPSDPTQDPSYISRQETFIKELAAAIGKVQRLSREARDLKVSLNDSAKNTQELEAATRDAQKRSTDNATAITDDRRRIAEIIAEINDTLASAKALDQRVTEYQPKFAEFDRALAKRTEEITEGERHLRELLDANMKARKESEDLVFNAREALKWATAQGLAQGFSLEAESLNKPIKAALRAVYFSLFLLAVWAILIFILPNKIGLPLPSFTTLDPNHVGISIAQGFLALGTRLALLFPAIYLVLFCNKRYRELFIVREQYTFKKAIATAVPGFKEQAAPADADEHVRAMTAAAFERLLFNPREAATRDLSGEARGGPLSRWLVRIVARAIDETRKLGEKPPPK